MTRKEAIARIKDHISIHKICEERAVKITEALNMAISALEQSEPHWIPFDEQQPEYGQQILVTIHWHESGQEEYFVQQDTYFDDATLNSNFKIGRDVFAWMPLPEIYREEGD